MAGATLAADAARDGYAHHGAIALPQTRHAAPQRRDTADPFVTAEEGG
jgi:hypothetical protein